MAHVMTNPDICDAAFIRWTAIVDPDNRSNPWQRDCIKMGKYPEQKYRAWSQHYNAWPI